MRRHGGAFLFDDDSLKKQWRGVVTKGTAAITSAFNAKHGDADGTVEWSHATEDMIRECGIEGLAAIEKEVVRSARRSWWPTHAQDMLFPNCLASNGTVELFYVYADKDHDSRQTIHATIGKTTPNSSEGRHRSYGTHDNGRSVLLYEVYADPALNENNVKRLFREWGLEIVNGKTRKRGEGFAMSSEQFQIVKDPDRLRAAIASAR